MMSARMARVCVLSLTLLVTSVEASAYGPFDAMSVPQGEVLEQLDSHPSDPVLLVRAAREARREGRLVDAAWLTDLAMRLPGDSALVAEEACALGWELGDRAVKGASPEPLPPAWPWWLAGGLLLVALGSVAWRLGDTLGLGALFVGTIAAALVMPPTEVLRPSLPEALMTLSEGAPCETDPMTWRDGRLYLSARCAGKARQIMVTRTVQGQPAIAHSARHSVSYLGQGGSPEVQALVNHVAMAMTSAEAQGYTIAHADTSTPSRLDRWQGSDPVVRATLRVSAGLAAATVWILLMLLMRLLKHIARRGVPRELWAPVALGVLGLLLVPATMRMVYGGYDLTTHLIDGVIPRYGAGALWFYGLPQWLISGDHAWVQALNRLYGVGCLFAVIALTERWFPGKGPRRIVAWLLATLPIVFAAFSCESIHAGPTLGILVSLWLLSGDDVAHPVAACLPWLAAAVTRPEMAVMALLAPVLIWDIRGRGPIKRSWVVFTAALGAGVTLLVIGWDIVQTTQAMASQSAVSLGPELIGKAVSAGLIQSILASPQVTPTVVLGLVVAAVAVASLRTIAVPVLCFAILWMALTGVDHAPVSLPRIQLTPLLLCLPLAAAAVLELSQASRALRAGLALLYLVGVGYSALSLWAPTNEDHEEALWREAAQVLPEGPLCLAAMGYGDPPEAGLSPRHNPSYLVTGPGRVVRHLGALDSLVKGCEGPVYALLGTRCHVAMRGPGDPTPGAQGLPICQEVRATQRLEPVIEREVNNRGDLAYPMYPRSDTFSVGLYRVAR